jgi:voltage-gated potassium channel
VSPALRFTLAAVMLATLILGGTLGYRMIEGWTLLDSLYMTVITVSTVGFGEVHPLSASGRHFTMLLLAASLLVAGYGVTTSISFMFEGHIGRLVRGRRMERAFVKAEGPLHRLRLRSCRERGR